MVMSQELEGVHFGDARLNERCKSILAAMQAGPDRSFPQMVDTWGAVKATYRFFNNSKVTREKILQGHIANTIQRCAGEEIVLAVQDTTTLSYNTHCHTEGLGHVGTLRQQGLGMLVHSVCCVAGDDHAPLGLLHQEVIVRNVHYPRQEGYRQRLSRARESDKWGRAATRTKELLSSHSHVVHVCDREADIYFLMRDIGNMGQGFVIRQTRERHTEDGFMHTSVNQTQRRGMMMVDIQRNGNRLGRQAQVTIRAGHVNILSPNAHSRIKKSLSVNLITVTELTPPRDVSPLSWVLLTSEPIETLEDCIAVVRHYQARWIVEEFHKGLKTGCKIESRQLATRQRLENMLGLCSIIAILLLYLRFQSRIKPNSNVDNILSAPQRTILQQKFPNETGRLSTQRALILIARLGGFLARKSDGSPGWLTLMRGYYELLYIEQGFLMAQSIMGKG